MLLTGSERTALRRAVRLLSLNWLAIWRAEGAGFLGLGTSNALTATSSGATWVSIHHGGGVGIGRSIHTGQVSVADGTELAAGVTRRILH